MTSLESLLKERLGDSLTPSLLSQLSSKLERQALKKRLENDLVAFTSYFFEQRGEQFIPNDHHYDIAEALRAVERGEIQNLVINVPPRYTKTELVVKNWIAQCIARNAKAKFIHLSYSSELALDNSAKAREIIKSEAYQELWPVRIKDDSDSKQKWYTEEGGGLYANMAGGAVTGFGAGATVDDDDSHFYGAIIIDDPIKPHDAASETIRNSVNERLNSTIKSRRNSRNTPIIIIMQRLHEDDMTGFVLKGGMGEDFHHLKIPALEDGKALWPLKHTVEELERMRERDRMTFASQYQQEPAPAEGAVWKLHWFPRYDHLPKERSAVIHSWDTAFKAKEHNDPSACEIFHCTPSLHYLAEIVKGRMEYPELRRHAFRLAERDKPDAILIEDKASGQSLGQELRAAGFPVLMMKPEADKETRARIAAASIEAGLIALPQHAHWLLDFEQEATTFPNSKHDDQVDALSQFIKWVTQNGIGVSKSYENLLENW